PRRARSAAQPPCARSPAARALAAGNKRFGLGAGRRLTQKAQFERLLRDGRQKKVAGYLFYLESRDAGGPRLGLLVSRRHAARANERNRIKRCIREAFRLQQHRLGAIDLLVRPPYGVRPSPRMIVRLCGILATLSGA
ncbi:MAG: ribonuclease P protein component, partial [Burkholderiales bacterium]